MITKILNEERLEALARVFRLIDDKAHTKLGFIATPVLGSVGLGGIPAWLLSRAVAAILAGGLLWGYLAQRDHQTALRVGQEYQRQSAEQMKLHEKTLASIAKAAALDKKQLDDEWRMKLNTLTSINDDLETALVRERDKKPKLPPNPGQPTTQTACYPKPVADVLRKKAMEVNRRVLW